MNGATNLGRYLQRYGPAGLNVKLACDTEYGLALGIFTADVATGLALAERIPTMAPVTAGCRSVHAIATSPADRPWRRPGSCGAAGSRLVGVW